MTNRMKKLFHILFIVLVFSTTPNGQSSNKPLLLGKSSPYYEDQDKLYHAIESTTEMFRKDPNALLAVRVCSTDPLPIAYVNAAGLDWVIKQFNEQLDYLRKQIFSVNIPASRVYYLRNDKGCGSYKNINLTEYWFISSSADFPEFIEFGKPENIAEKTLVFASQVDEELISGKNSGNFIPLKSGEYEVFKDKLVKMLRENKTSLVLINYPTFETKQRPIFINASKLKKFLIEAGIRSQRIFVKSSKIDNFADQPQNFSSPNISILYQ